MIGYRGRHARSIATTIPVPSTARVIALGALAALGLTLLVILLAGVAATSAHAQDALVEPSGSVTSAPTTSSATNDTQTSTASSTSDPASSSSTKPPYTRHPAPTGVVISRSPSSSSTLSKPAYTPAEIVGTLVVRQAAPSSSSTSFTKPPYTRRTIVSVYVSRSATATATAPNQTTTAGGTTSTSYTQHAAPRAVVFRQAPASSQLAYTGPSPVLQLAISGALALLIGVLLGWLSTRHTPRRH